MRDTPVLIVITGPTASGKSALAAQVARRLGTGVIGADSRQVYTGIPISTALPTEEERAMAPHHLIDFLPLEAYYSASLFEQDAMETARRLMEQSGYAVACGGSMLYIDALCHGIDDIPTVADSIRNELKEEHRRLGDEWLLSELKLLDPEYYAEADLKNIKRIFHAVEIIRASGQTYTSLRKGTHTERDFRIIKISLEAERQLLFSRINTRVDRMVAAGLEEEARRVWPMRHLNSLNTVGLKEMFAYFNGEMPRETAIERIKKNTRVYAKKQKTWWKRDNELLRLPADASDLTERVLSLI